jgi:RNase H-fold protein (predicted Holliday junction resolvase)
MILGIDPGTRKCGYAVLEQGGGVPVAIGIVETPGLGDLVAELLRRHPIEAVALGGGTHATLVALILAGCGLPVHVVDERETSLRARSRYFRDHPPRGWRRLVPRGMLLPPRPVDDYAALLIAERYAAAAASDADRRA